MACGSEYISINASSCSQINTMTQLGNLGRILLAFGSQANKITHPCSLGRILVASVSQATTSLVS